MDDRYILLTGGLGFIGSHTAVELLEAGYSVVIADDLSNSDISALGRIEAISGRKPAFYQIDVSDRRAVRRVFKAHDISAVVHFAGFKAVGESVSVPVKYYRNNIDSMLSVLEEMDQAGCKRVIFSSSATVYGESNPVPYREDMPAGACSNPYGWTKFMIERILIDKAHAAELKGEDFKATLLRYFNPIGAHPSGLIGEKPNGIPNNLMPYITQVAAGIRPKLSVFGNDYDTPDGTGVRDYIHVVDLAKGHLAALGHIERDESESLNIFNLGTGRGYSVLDVVKAFEKVNGVPVPYEIAPRRAGDLAWSYADASLAEKTLGWKAELGIEEMCRDSWNWQNGPACRGEL